ncbi:hypothetical protein C4565_00255 [Candidatus Parcubacteria bacterium]|nr:MAG: hypothetical protein C4565_00255 [Candidatus Parcubacteria bacterium]
MNNVVLFGSLLNPLSAVAASFFHHQGILKAIVIPKKERFTIHYSIKGGIVFFLSQILIGIHRYGRVLLRILNVNRSTKYSCLLEFISSHPSVPVAAIARYDGDIDLFFLGKNIKVGHDSILISCIFPFKIPVKSDLIKYRINIHPGVLPENRGPNPYFWALAKRELFSGITFHQLTETFDQGPIMHIATFAVDFTESEYQLEKRAVECLDETLPYFMDNFIELYKNPSPQTMGRYYTEPDKADRIIHGKKSWFNGSDLIWFMARIKKDHRQR